MSEIDNVRSGIGNAPVGGLLGGASQKFKEKTQQFPSYFKPIYGWVCPRCGRGNSPSNNTCLCIPFEMKVTC